MTTDQTPLSAGSGTVNLTVYGPPTIGKSFSPAYAGNGKIVFASTRDGHSEIYVMNADGSSPIRLTNSASSVSNASPDSQ